MLAFACVWGRKPGQSDNLSRKLAASLCAGIGGHAGNAQVGAAHFAYRPLRSTAAQCRSWRPAVLPNGHVAAFHGYFDNATTIAHELGVPAADLSALYAAAVERWGDDADRRIVGEYCAVIVDPSGFRARLSR